VRQTWFSRRAIGLHVVIIVVVPTFAGLCLWQIHRALGGNDLSWAYVFEWPFFAGYAIYMWWRLLHEAPLAKAERDAASARHSPGETSGRRATGAATRGSVAGSTSSDSRLTYSDPAVLDHAVTVNDPAFPVNDTDLPDPDEADRAAYNQYLSELATRGKRKQWR